MAKRRWKRGLAKRNGWAYLLGAAVLLPVLGYVAFEKGFGFGLSFLWAASAAVVNGYILRHPYLLVFVYVGVVLSSEPLPQFMEGTLGVALAGQLLPSLLLVVVGLVLWAWSRDLKTGAMFRRRRWR